MTRCAHLGSPIPALALWWISPWLICAPLAGAADPASPRTFVTPEQAQQHPGFVIQGEYKSPSEGVQVVALGEDEFQIVRYPGGLPGGGANGDQRQESQVDLRRAQQITASLQRVERSSPTLGMPAPEDAVVLFDGSQESLRKRWQPGAKMTEDGLLVSGCTSRDTFTDFIAHLEFRTPFMPDARGQKRGNSGAYWQGRYETQILDSFGLQGVDNECGAIYRISAPSINMCLPPLLWQTYDVDFTAARYDLDGDKTSNARLTVRLNGVLVQDDIEVPHSTTAAPVKEGPRPGPVYLQDHGNPVRYRNVWVQAKE